MVGSIIYFHPVSFFVACGACPVVCPYIAVAVHGGAYNQSSQSVVERVGLQLYFGNVYSLSVSCSICQLILSGCASSFYANEFSVAVYLYVWVYALVKEEIHSVERVLAFIVARCEYEYRYCCEYVLFDRGPCSPFLLP